MMWTLSGWSKNFDSETDWNLKTEPMGGVDGRQVKLSRGKFLVRPARSTSRLETVTCLNPSSLL